MITISIMSVSRKRNVSLTISCNIVTRYQLTNSPILQLNLLAMEYKLSNIPGAFKSYHFV